MVLEQQNNLFIVEKEWSLVGYIFILYHEEVISSLRNPSKMIFGTKLLGRKLGRKTLLSPVTLIFFQILINKAKRVNMLPRLLRYQDKNVNIFMAACQFFRLNHRCIFCCKAVLHVIYYTTGPKMVSYEQNTLFTCELNTIWHSICCLLT